MPDYKQINIKTWFVIAAFNEASVIEPVIKEIIKKYPNVIVVDDGSSDKTSCIANTSGAKVITHSINLGQGAALQTGITFALKHNAEYIVTYDADGQHRLSDAEKMLDIIQEQQCDIVLGSRFFGTTENLPRIRRLVLKAAISFTRLSTGLNITDTHNGLRVITGDAARGIKLQQNGMAHASEFLEQVANLGMDYREAAVHIKYTEYSLKKGQKLSNAVNILMDLLIEKLTKK
jgi:glycosyltransferase involved in cell wall biosynthesis